MEPDYYTVMAGRIKYFSLKYDPENQFGIEDPVRSGDLLKKRKKRETNKKLINSIQNVISIFI
jgi:hypothetical protein